MRNGIVIQAAIQGKSVLTILLFSLMICSLAAASGADSLFTAGGRQITGTDRPQGSEVAHPKLATGVLLIAGKNLNDRNFERTVILITGYDAGGTTGLVLNRRTKIPVRQALPDIEEITALLDDLYIGGPVATNHIRLLVKADQIPHGARQMVDDVYLIDTMESFKRLDLKGMDNHSVRLYMGFAGWAPGQLETEMLRGDWHTLPATSRAVFNATPENLWYELIYLAMAIWT
jgi:Putative transcriptional regulator